MAESVRPSSSKTAMSIAFKKARRKFPKNFGLTSNRAEKESSENEDLSSCRNEERSKSPVKSFEPTNENIYQKSIPEDVESGLIDSFKEVKLTEEPEIISDPCQDKSDNFVDVDLKLDPIPVVEENDKCENVYLEKQEFAYDYGYENELPPKSEPSNYTCHETRQNIGLFWNNESDHCDNYDTEIDEAPPRKYDETTPMRKKRQLHRRKKSSHCHSDYIYEDQRFEYSTSSCPCHEHCAHCYQHYYRHCSCCRMHYCCCSQCCLIWQDRAVIAPDGCPNCRRRRSKKKRCSTCNGKRRASSPSITCSRDSGIFTQTRYEDYYDEDDEDASATLMHKDSLSILQEKYAKKSRRDDDEERGKGRKTRKRISSRHSYY